MEDLNTFLLKKSIGRIKYTQSQLRQPVKSIKNMTLYPINLYVQKANPVPAKRLMKLSVS